MQIIVPALGVINIVNHTFCGTMYAFQPDTVWPTLDAQHSAHIDAELRRMLWTVVTPVHGARQECAESALIKPKWQMNTEEEEEGEGCAVLNHCGPSR